MVPADDPENRKFQLSVMGLVPVIPHNWICTVAKHIKIRNILHLNFAQKLQFNQSHKLLLYWTYCMVKNELLQPSNFLFCKFIFKFIFFFLILNLDIFLKHVLEYTT